MNEAEERKAFDKWYYAKGQESLSCWEAWMARAAIAEPAAEDYNHVPLKPAFTVQATYEHTGKMSPRKFPDEPAAEPLCVCEDRPANQCPGQWEPGCDLGNNEEFVRVAEPAAEPVEDDLTVAYMVGFHRGKEAHPPRAQLTTAQIEKIHDEESCLPDMIGMREQWPEIVRFARAIEAAHGIKESE
jgi:hypothetical protein